MIFNKMSSQFILGIILTISPFFSKGQTDFKLIPAPFPIPLDSVEQLSYLVPIVNKDKNLDSNLIIIYGFTGCKPCEMLQRKIQNKIINGSINSTSIVYVNIFDLDANKLIAQLTSKNISFPYYTTKSPYLGAINGSFPIISAYSNGGKQWSVFGYRTYNIRKMIAHMSKKQ